ncbi:MAG: FAD-dependent oxidoreductase [Thermoplasmata archaeon]
MSEKGKVLRSIRKGEGRLTGPMGEFSIYTEGQTSCAMACPAGVDIKAYVNLIADRRYEDAVQVIRRNNPFPGICGRVCTHPCEAECGRKELDGAVSIKALKRFASDYELSRKKPGISRERTRSEKVAVVGAGPAGLTAAADLALAGFHVTVFDGSKNAGGLMAWGIPDFRLPKNIVRSEVRDIQALGVDIVTGKRVEKPQELLKKGYSAVVLATGCQAPMLADIPGEKGAMDCLAFLRDVSEGNPPKLGSKVIVIGGGNAALDSARTALRLGADVTVAYRRTEEQMPADADEINHAKEEGVKFEFLVIPIEIIPGKGMKFQRAKLGEPDASGRRSPVPVPNEYFDIRAGNVIMAIGSKPDPTAFPKEMRLTKRGTPEVNDDGMTSVPGMFAAGDLATGPSTIVDAIGSGHCAAAGVMRFLGADIAAKGPGEMLVVENPSFEGMQRCGTCFIPLEKRQSTFEEAEIGLAERDAITEALRCRRCGSCDACDVCLAVCDYRNAMITVTESGESALAKIPFELAVGAMEYQENAWKVEAWGSSVAARVEPVLARVNEELCIACGKCEEACPYKAIRTVFNADEQARAVVEASACRGCGACSGACPAGAITMGYMDDEKLYSRLREAVMRSKENSGIVRFSCMWNGSNAKTERWPWEVKVQCTRRLSPAILVEALALGARAVSVMGCEEDECHYLPGPWMGPDVVGAARDVLGAIGIDPRRVAYLDSPDSAERFITGIMGRKSFRSGANLPATRSSLGRCLNAAQVLMAQPDETAEVKANGKALLGYGCMAMSEPTFAAYGIQDTDVMASARRLLETAGIEYAMAGMHISGASLKEWGMDGLYREYADGIASTLKKSGADILIIPTPKSYETFKGMKLGCRIASLPGVLKENLAGKFSNASETVAYHPACAGSGEFDADCLELLALIPGLKVVKVDGACGDSGWRDVKAETREKALALLEKAEKMGALTLVAGSTRCAVHLKAVTGGWSTSPVKVMDIYTFLASKLGGEA